MHLSSGINVRPVTSGADQDEEEHIDCERVRDGHDGAFRDGNTRSLQLSFKDVSVEVRENDMLPK